MVGYEYVQEFLVNSSNWVESLKLAPPTETPGGFCGRHIQDIHSPYGTLFLYSRWNNGRLDGNTSLRNEYGEDLIILPFHNGVLSGTAICQTTKAICNIEFFDNHPTGNVTFTDSESSERYSCTYSNSATCRYNGSGRGGSYYPKIKVMDTIRKAPEPREVERISPINIQHCNAEDYCKAYSDYLWYSSMAQVYRFYRNTGNEEGARQRVLNAQNTIKEIEQCLTTHSEIDSRISEIRRQYKAQQGRGRKDNEDKKDGKRAQAEKKYQEVEEHRIRNLIEREQRRKEEERKKEEDILDILKAKKEENERMKRDLLFQTQLAQMDKATREEELAKRREEEERERRRKEEEERRKREEEERRKKEEEERKKREEEEKRRREEEKRRKEEEKKRKKREEEERKRREEEERKRREEEERKRREEEERKRREEEERKRREEEERRRREEEERKRREEEERKRREEEERKRREEEERKRREEEEKKRREEEEERRKRRRDNDNKGNGRQPHNGNRRVIEVATTEELLDYSPRIEQDNLTPERGVLKNELEKDKVNLKSAAANKLRKKNRQ